MNNSDHETGSSIDIASPSQNVLLSKDEVSRILIGLGLATLLGGIEGDVNASNVKTTITHFSEFLIQVLPGLTESTLVTDMLSIVPKHHILSLFASLSLIASVDNVNGHSSAIAQKHYLYRDRERDAAHSLQVASIMEGKINGRNGEGGRIVDCPEASR